MLSPTPKRRLELIDSIRGLTLVSMILYHFVWDMVYLYSFKWSWFYRADIWQQSICWTFIILSGFAFSLSRNSLKRGLIVFISGIIITLVTLIATPKTRIVFGILTLLGSCMLILTPIKKLLAKIPSGLGMILSFSAFLFTRNCNRGYLGFGNFKLDLPDFLYSNYLTAYLGFPSHSFYSSDYFAIFPWIFLFVFGFFIFKLLEKYNLIEKLFLKGKIPVISFLGKHSLVVYLLHQPIIYGLCEAIKYFS